MTDDLAARRAAVAKRIAERRLAKQLAESIAAVKRVADADETARQILRSARRHPSNPAPYDREAEE